MAFHVFVTGATGNVGRQVVRALAARGVHVRAGARNPANVEKPAQVEVVWLDYDQPETFVRAMVGIDGLALLTPPFSPPNEVAWGCGLVDAAKAAGVKHIVKLSIMGAQTNEASAHRRVERYIEASGILYTHLRPNFYMQNYNLYYADDIKQHNQIYLPSGNGKQSLIDVRDIGEAFAAVFTQPGHENKAYDLTGGEALDHYDIAAVLSNVLGRTITYPNPSPEEYRRTMQAAGVPDGTIDFMIGLYGGLVAQGGVASVTPDLPQLIGRSPLSFAQYAQDHAQAWL